MGVQLLFLLRLGRYSEQAGDECDLPFPDHVHDLVSLQGLPCALKRKEAQSRFDQPLDEPVVLFNDVVKVFDLP
jgi:hypothetical protein